MKKKFGLWFNIVTICLCVCAIAIGVYSATTANLNASGKLGFTAHNCKADITGTIYGHATGNSADGLPVAEADAETFGTVSLDGDTKSLSLGETRYFTDMASTDGSVAPIVITLAITNTSKFDIVASVTSATATSPVAIESPTEDVKITQNSTESLTFTLTLTSTANGVTPSSDNVNISLHLEKYVSPFYVADNKLFVNMGTDPDTGNPIRWYAIAKDNAGTFETLKSTQVTSVEAGTYVFISEYILDYSDSSPCIEFNSTATSSNNYGANYEGSIIQSFVNGNDANSLYTKYKLGNAKYADVYGNILPYRWGEEEISDYITSSKVTCPASERQTLWLLSNAEYILCFGDGDTSGVAKMLSTNLNNNWWLRSPNSYESMGGYCDVWYVKDTGGLGYEPVPGGRFGVRPAFQITIS